MSSTPIDLILANVLDQTANNYIANPRLYEALTKSANTQLSEAVARSLIASAAVQGSTAVIMRMLAAAGAPTSLEEYRQRLAAVIDAKREEAKP